MIGSQVETCDQVGAKTCDQVGAKTCDQVGENFGSDQVDGT